MPPGEALNRAQKWLRNADAQQLGVQEDPGSRRGKAEYDKKMEGIFLQNEKYPYSNPYFWAPFTFAGA
jgi:CHAT domain-containing protein